MYYKLIYLKKHKHHFILVNKKILNFIKLCLVFQYYIVHIVSKVLQKLNELNIQLPYVSSPVANYISSNKSGNLLYLSGQLPKNESSFICGKLGENISIEDAQKAAELCTLHAFAQVKKEIGDLDLIKKCVKINVFINATPDFKEHPMVANGASDLMVKILGENGKHARSAFGVSSLPFGACVEVEVIFEI